MGQVFISMLLSYVQLSPPSTSLQCCGGLAEKGQLGATAGFPGAWAMPGFPAGLD